VTAGAASARPNVVIILADDLGYGDTGMTGCPDIRTPNIDSIARAGVRFTQFYASAPECSPTRTALLTGRYPHRVGGLECAIGVGNNGRYDEAIWLQKRGELGLPETELTIGRLMRGAGYDTAAVGKWHLGYPEKFWPNRHGFDYWFSLLGGGADYYTKEEFNEGVGQVHLLEDGRPAPSKQYTTDLFASKAIAWLRTRSKTKPFFLYLPFTAPHVPLQNPAEFDAATGTAPVRTKDRKAYAAMVERMDHCIGDVLAQLDAMGVAQDTLVIFTSDNGGEAAARNDPFRGKKSSVYEGGLRVPAAARWPARIRAGQVTDQVSLTMDLLPTVLAAAGITPPKERKLDGIDLLPVLDGREKSRSRTVFFRYKRGENRRKAVRKGDWKYANDSGKEELFDLARDPGEKTDLLAMKPEIAKDLRAELDRWEVDVRAPRLRDFRP